jgi:hypothetical protein
MMIRTVVALIFSAALAPAWVESVEFPWNAYPKQLWERELVWLKNIGVTHVSLPPAQDVSQLTEVLQIIRRLGIEADLEGPIPESLLPLSRAHGGFLTGPLPGPAARISTLAPSAVTHSRELLTSGTAALIWTDVEETLGPSGYRPGAVNFAGEETSATGPLRQSIQLSSYWSKTLASLHPIPGAGVTLAATPTAKQDSAGPSVRQFAGANNISVVSVVNKSANPWTGDLKVFYPTAARSISVPGVSVPAHDALWLPVDVPLTAGPLCKDCSAFSNADRLVYATAELTDMEYENGILAMEFTSHGKAEAVLQLAREPYGPLVAGGRPVEFDWDEHTQRVRLPIPAGKGAGSHVRIGIAIEPPDATAFFDSAHVLLIGETNSLTAQFSSDAIAQRSRLRSVPAFESEQQPGSEPLARVYQIKVPGIFVSGDHADLAIEADGMQMSHARPQLLVPVAIRVPDAISVHLSAASALPLFPATVAVNQRAGRDLTISLRNNAPEIRNFQVELKGDGIEFSPEKLQVTVGASVARDISFRVFAREAAPGLHSGTISVSGAASSTEPVQFAVFPEGGAVAFSTGGFSLIESAKFRASFMPGRWLELVNKENNQNLLASTGMPFKPGSIEVRGDALAFQSGQQVLKLEDLQQLAQQPKH